MIKYNEHIAYLINNKTIARMAGKKQIASKIIEYVEAKNGQ